MPHIASDGQKRRKILDALEAVAIMLTQARADWDEVSASATGAKT